LNILLQGRVGEKQKKREKNKNKRVAGGSTGKKGGGKRAFTNETPQRKCLGVWIIFVHFKREGGYWRWGPKAGIKKRGRRKGTGRKSGAPELEFRKGALRCKEGKKKVASKGGNTVNGQGTTLKARG